MTTYTSTMGCDCAPGTGINANATYCDLSYWYITEPTKWKQGQSECKTGCRLMQDKDNKDICVNAAWKPEPKLGCDCAPGTGINANATYCDLSYWYITEPTKWKQGQSECKTGCRLMQDKDNKDICVNAAWKPEFCDWGYTVVHPTLQPDLNSDGKTWDGGGCPTDGGKCKVYPNKVDTASYAQGWNFTYGTDYHVIKCPTRDIASEMAKDLAGEVLVHGVSTTKAVGEKYRNSIYNAWWNSGSGGGTFRTQGDPERHKTAPNPGQPCYWHKNYPGPTTRKCDNVKATSQFWGS